MVAIRLFSRLFHPLLNPLTTLLVRNMHEFNADRPAVVSTRCCNVVAFDIQLRIGLRLEETKRINICLEIPPSTE